METIKISIIVPVYKVENYLQQCIESIVGQTYLDLEIILVDDGSPDNCGKICDEYAIKDPRIKVIHKKNGGLSAARNAGLDICTGEYIGFVDSDDRIHPQMYEILLDGILKSKADMAACQYLSFEDQEENALNEREIEQVAFACVETAQLIGNYFSYIPDIIPVSPCSKLYKRKLFAETRFKSGIIYEDLQILSALLSRSGKITYCNVPLYWYRQSPNSTIRSAFSQKNLVMLDIWKDDMIPFLRTYSTKQMWETAYDRYIDYYSYCCFMAEKYIELHLSVSREHKRFYKKVLLRRFRAQAQRGGKQMIILLLLMLNANLAYRFALSFFPAAIPK